MRDKPEYITLPKSMVFFWLCLTMTLLTIFIFPIYRMKSNEAKDNPHRAPYYITLQSILANNASLGFDQANIKFIKHKMLAFEQNVKAAETQKPLALPYQQAYQNILHQYGVTSIKSLKSAPDILQAAKGSFKIIDSYYLDDRINRVSPLYQWQPWHERYILQYNLGSLFDVIPDKNKRMLVAFTNGSQLGVFSGYFVNNQTTTLTTQFVTGIPLLTALYVLPKCNFTKMGSYLGEVPWVYFSANTFQDTLSRKLLDISGIDVFAVANQDMKKNKIHGFANTTKITADISKQFADASIFVNNQSYGMAYLANQIIDEDPHTVQPLEQTIKGYFAQIKNHDVSTFQKTTHIFYQKLMALKNQHDIILETLSPSSSPEDLKLPAGNVTIKGIVGERALFNAQCLRNHCTFVVNFADSPGWHAYVNGKIQPIERANFAFMATTIPKGFSTIWFIYSSAFATCCFLISLLTLLIILLVSFNPEKNHEK